MTTQPETTAPPIDEIELDRMLSALADGMLTTSERDRLEDLLDRDAAARQRYLEFMRVEFLLASEIGYAMPSGGLDDLEAAREVERKPEEPLPEPQANRGRYMGPAAAAVAFVAMLAAAASILPWRGKNAADPSFARLTASSDAVWDGDSQPGAGKPVVTGPLRLVEGTAQITFASGAVVAVHAPAAIEVLGENRLFLRSGRVTPFVPPSAKGFTVVSPSGEVVDFGTEFSIGVGDDGKTDVFVIDGEVAVAGGHGRKTKPMHLTQGFASQFMATAERPTVTLRPIVVDHFDAEGGPLLRRDWEADQASAVQNGKLSIPIDGRPHRRVSTVHTTLENDFAQLAGRRSVISFKATLPNVGNAHHGRWVALVIDDGEGDPPHAAEPPANLGVMLSPFWKVGMRVAGGGVRGLPSSAFRRAEEEVGPFQVVMAIDDSPEAHAKHGQAVVTVMVNGLEFIRDYPFTLPAIPRLSFHTHVRAKEGGAGYALIDDFSVSIDSAE